MNLCQRCQVKPSHLKCACGKYTYCSTECCSNDDAHACKPELDFGYYVSILHTFVPVMESLKDDPELHNMCKALTSKLVSRLSDSTENYH